jgi:hypothetical protein
VITWGRRVRLLEWIVVMELMCPVQIVPHLTNEIQNVSFVYCITRFWVLTIDSGLKESLEFL